MSALSSASGPAAPRWLLVASLSLNLFFVGAGLALLVRGAPMGPVPQAATPEVPSPRVRIDRLAATLPPADSRLLMARFNAVQDKLAAAEAVSRAAQERARAAFDAAPFDPAQAQAALAQLRDARRDIWAIVHEVITAAGQEMSQEGRNRIAAWVPPVQKEPAAR